MLQEVERAGGHVSDVPAPVEPEKPKPKRLTKAQRLAIATLHMKRSEDGRYVPQEFVDAARDEDHPAHGWFTWDDGEAAEKWRVAEGRRFVQGLPVEVSVPAVDYGEPLPVKTVTVPALVSDESGDGYVSVVTDAGMETLKECALREYARWAGRHRSHLLVKTQRLIDRLMGALEKEAS